MQYPFTSDKDRTIDDGVTMVDAPSAGGASAAARKVFAPGDLIAGRYAVVRKLGEGGMGIVYQCLDQVGGVEVAVKGLPPEVSRDADEMEEIRANYQLVSRLHHPNIATARTLERDVATGDYYLVMDLASGTSLKHWMRDNPQATMEAKLSILRQVSAALDYAHSMKVIHRDVKPENVMVDSEGHAMVLDFGLAAQIRSSQSRTSNAVKSRSGSPGYKSPEQWLGRAQRASADVYSFGVMAYWMLAGELPFDGDDLVVLGHAVLTAPVEPVSGLPDYMNAALIKALAKKPEDRFSSCGEVVAVLEGSLKVPCGGAKARRGVIGKIAAAVLFASLVYGVFWLLHRGTDSMIVTPKHDDTKTITLPGGATMDLIYVRPGEFIMGDDYGDDDEKPVHSVRLTRGFWLGKCEVTQEQWQSVMGENPSVFKGDGRLPVDNVSWENCQKFIRKVDAAVRRQLGGTARLPSEAEWEYACRAGTRGPYAKPGLETYTLDNPKTMRTLEDMGWYDGNSGSKTHSVGQKSPNPWGFYDMHGNVWEWCNDWYGDDYYKSSPTNDPQGLLSGECRVLRGGSWSNVARNCRSANRIRCYPGDRVNFFGFRLCCSAQP